MTTAPAPIPARAPGPDRSPALEPTAGRIPSSADLGEAVPAARPQVRRRIGQVLLTLLFALCAVISASTAVAPDPFEPAAVVLIATFGCLAAVLGTAAAWSTATSRTARLALWALPAFFVVHVAALGTWLPDAVLAVVAAVAVLLVSGEAPVRRSRR